MLKDKKIVVIGAGTMGKAIIKGLLNAGQVNDIQAIERCQKTADKARLQLDITVCPISDAENIIKQADIIVLCVKPQDIANCMNSVKEWLNTSTLIITIAAGISTGFIENILQTKNIHSLKLML